VPTRGHRSVPTGKDNGKVPEAQDPDIGGDGRRRAGDRRRRFDARHQLLVATGPGGLRSSDRQNRQGRKRRHRHHVCDTGRVPEALIYQKDHEDGDQKRKDTAREESDRVEKGADPRTSRSDPTRHRLERLPRTIQTDIGRQGPRNRPRGGTQTFFWGAIRRIGLPTHTRGHL